MGTERGQEFRHSRHRPSEDLSHQSFQRRHRHRPARTVKHLLPIRGFSKPSFREGDQRFAPQSWHEVGDHPVEPLGQHGRDAGKAFDPYVSEIENEDLRHRRVSPLSMCAASSRTPFSGGAAVATASGLRHMIVAPSERSSIFVCPFSPGISAVKFFATSTAARSLRHTTRAVPNRMYGIRFSFP